MVHDDIHDLTTANRLLAADVLAGLDQRQWSTETLCAGWTVHDMAAHLVQPMVVGFGRFLVTALRYRGDTSRTVDHITRRLARKPRDELVTLLREHAGDRLDPPRVGPMGPFADSCIHLRDIARPLRVAADVPAEHWQILLDYLTGPSAATGLVPPGRLEGLALRAADADWAAGEGVLVRGPLEALAMAVTGRRVALADLDGPGVDVLAGRVAAGRRLSGAPTPHGQDDSLN